MKMDFELVQVDHQLFFQLLTIAASVSENVYVISCNLYSALFDCSVMLRLANKSLLLCHSRDVRAFRRGGICTQWYCSAL